MEKFLSKLLKSIGFIWRVLFLVNEAKANGFKKVRKRGFQKDSVRMNLFDVEKTHVLLQIKVDFVCVLDSNILNLKNQILFQLRV